MFKVVCHLATVNWGASQVVLVVKPACQCKEPQKTWIRSLGGEGPLGEGQSNPLHYSCLEDPMDRGELDTTEVTAGTHTQLITPLCGH